MTEGSRRVIVDIRPTDFPAQPSSQGPSRSWVNASGDLRVSVTPAAGTPDLAAIIAQTLPVALDHVQDADLGSAPTPTANLEYEVGLALSRVEQVAATAGATTEETSVEHQLLVVTETRQFLVDVRPETGPPRLPGQAVVRAWSDGFGGVRVAVSRGATKDLFALEHAVRVALEADESTASAPSRYPDVELDIARRLAERAAQRRGATTVRIGTQRVLVMHGPRRFTIDVRPRAGQPAALLRRDSGRVWLGEHGDVRVDVGRGSVRENLSREINHAVEAALDHVADREPPSPPDSSPKPTIELDGARRLVQQIAEKYGAAVGSTDGQIRVGRGNRTFFVDLAPEAGRHRLPGRSLSRVWIDSFGDVRVVVSPGAVLEDLAALLDQTIPVALQLDQDPEFARATDHGADQDAALADAQLQARQMAEQAVRDGGAHPNVIADGLIEVVHGSGRFLISIGPEAEQPNFPGQAQSRVGIDEAGGVQVTVSPGATTGLEALIGRAVEIALAAPTPDGSPRTEQGKPWNGVAEKNAVQRLVAQNAQGRGATTKRIVEGIQVDIGNRRFVVGVRLQPPSSGPAVSRVGIDDLGGVSVVHSAGVPLSSLAPLIEQAITTATEAESRSPEVAAGWALVETAATTHGASWINVGDKPGLTRNGQLVFVEVRTADSTQTSHAVARVDLERGPLRLIVFVSDAVSTAELAPLVDGLVEKALDHDVHPVASTIPGHNADPELGLDAVPAMRSLVADWAKSSGVHVVANDGGPMRLTVDGRTITFDVAIGNPDMDSPARIGIDAAGNVQLLVSPGAPATRVRSLLEQLLELSFSTDPVVDRTTDPRDPPAQPDVDRGTDDDGPSDNGPSEDGPGGKRITASEVPGSAFYGQQNWFAHPRLVNRRIAKTMRHLAEAAGVAEIIPRSDGTYDVRTAGGRWFQGSAAAGKTLTDQGLPSSDVAQSTIGPTTGRLDITISDRAISRAVPRALVHEIAEAAAILDGLGNRADLLTDQALLSDTALPVDQPMKASDLSAHDHGRIAELRHLSGLLDSSNPLTRWRAAQDGAALLTELGLRSGAATTSGFDGRSASFERRLAALSVDDQVHVVRLNSLSQVGSLPSAVAESWRYLARGLISGTVSGVLPGAVLALAALAGAPAVMLTYAVVTASAGLASSVVSSMVDRTHLVRMDSKVRLVWATVPLAPPMRQLMDTEAADLADQATRTRRATAELEGRLPDAQGRQRSFSRAVQQQDTGPVGRHSPPRPAEARSAEQSRRGVGTASSDSDQALREAAKAALEPRAGDRFSASDMLPGRLSWVMRTTLGPLAGVGIGGVAYFFSIASLGMVASPILPIGLAIGAAAAVVNLGRSYRRLALNWAAGEDAQENTKLRRHEAMARARIEHLLHPLRDQQAALDARAAHRQALADWLTTAEQALIDDAADPAGRRVAALPPAPTAPEAASRDRDSDITDRAATIDISAIPDSAFDSEGRPRPDPTRAERAALATLADLGPRDGVVSKHIGDGVVELRYDNQPEPIAVRVTAVPASTLREDSLVARVRRPDGTGPYVLEISDRAIDLTTERATLTALDQILAELEGSPASPDQLVPGATQGPIDPDLFTAADHGRIEDITRLLLSLEQAGGRSQRNLLAEYHAAVRAAGLDLPNSPDIDPGSLGSPARRVALDPELLAAMQARDPLPAVTPSFWAHQRRWVGPMAVPALLTPLAILGLSGLSEGALLRALIGFTSPLVIGSASGLGEWQVSRSIEKRQLELEIGETIPSQATVAREEAYRGAVASAAQEGKRRADAADRALEARRARFDAAVAHVERGAGFRPTSLPAHVIYSQTLRGDSPSGAAAPSARANAPSSIDPGTASASAKDGAAENADSTPGPDLLSSSEADRAAAEAIHAEAAAIADETVDTSGTRPSYTSVKAQPLLREYAGSLVAVPAATTGVAIGVGMGIGGLSFAELFNPPMLSQVPVEYLGVGAGAMLTAATAAASGMGVFGERLVGSRNPELLAAQEIAMGAQAEQLFAAARSARLAPLQQDLANAQAELARVQTAVALVEDEQAARRSQALANLFGGPARESGNGGPTNGGPTNGGPTNGGPTNGGPTNGGPTNGAPASTGTTEGSQEAAPPPPADPQRAAVVAAAQRAAELVGGRLRSTHGDLLSLALPDGRTLGVHLS
ncbi:MAG: hypothetical protein M3381_08660, partial [Actinomycetota bacterium]|nr:hypothetical protein [Actinomycetota bacterium]